MEIKENTKKNNKTIRKNNFNHKSFNQIISFDEDFPIPKNIRWSIEKDLDIGVFQLAKYYNKPIMVNIKGKEFEKQPPNILENRHLFNSAGNYHNLIIKKIKREKIFYYYPNGKKHEFLEVKDYGTLTELENSLIEEKNYKGYYFCIFCNTTHQTKESFINHKSTNEHLRNTNYIVEENAGDYDLIFNDFRYVESKKDLFINLDIRLNKKNYYSQSEYRKHKYGGCKCCILSSSTALTKGHGNKSARKTKGRQYREKFLYDALN